VHSNLVNSFPEKSEKEIRSIEKKFYRHFCDYVMETVKLFHISDEQMKKRMHFTNSELIEELRSDGRPFFIYLGHQGNWEYVTSISLWIHPSLKGCQIYHPLSNKIMDKVMYRLRSRFNTLGIPQKNTLRAILSMMKEGKQPLLGLISDQRPQRYPEPEWMTFLNQDTPIITGGETLGRRLDAHFIYGSIKCVRRGYYEIALSKIEPSKEEDFPYSKQYMRMLEADIRNQPHMWLWSHKRWSFKRSDYKKD
jgi:KDO2-lipid IV(A) lauroyltransferase